MNFVVYTLIRSYFIALGRRGEGRTEDKLVEVRLKQQRFVAVDWSAFYSFEFISLRFDTELSAFSVRSSSFCFSVSFVAFAVGNSLIWIRLFRVVISLLLPSVRDSKLI